jgi:ADP-ribose pyrophosphatase
VSDPIDARPKIRIEVVEDRTPHSSCDRGFLRLKRLSLQNAYDDGSKSDVYAYDLVERSALDAVAIVLYARDPLRVCLRSALRPPLAFRPGYSIPIEEREAEPVQWEVPAGLIEPEERGEAGLRACAARETLEEVGLEIGPSSFELLGPAAYLSPGVLAEKIFFLCAEVDPQARGVPTEDGSPTEERAKVHFATLADALAACRDGRIADVKTETAIRRLEEKLG